MENRDIPVIAMTAHVLDEFRQKAREAGMNDFIPKPVDADLLHGIIEGRPSDKDLLSVAGMLDREGALTALGGNQLLLGRIYEIFIGETPVLMEKLEQAIDKKDARGVYLMAHTLKGAGARIYAPLCTQAAKELETLAPTEDWTKIKALAEKVLSDFGDLIKILTPGQMPDQHPDQVNKEET